MFSNIQPIDIWLFGLPLALALTWFLVTNLLLGGLIDGDHEVEADHDVHLDVEAGADADAAVDHEIEADHEIEGDHDGGHGEAIWSALSYMGFGKVPVLLWFQMLFILWGAVGLLFLLWFDAVWIRVLLAMAGSFGGVTAISLLLVKVMPQKFASDIPTNQDLMGTTGKVTTSEVNEEFGQGAFVVKFGRITRQIRVRQGEPAIPQDTGIIVTGYEDGVLLVQREDELLAS